MCGIGRFGLEGKGLPILSTEYNTPVGEILENSFKVGQRGSVVLYTKWKKSEIRNRVGR